MHLASVLQVLAIGLSALRPVAAAAKVPNWITQSWFFSWDRPGAPFPVPITAQCETIHITWSRQTATGPDPVAPYYLHIFSSNFVFPFVIEAGPDPQADVTIPFAPGTQYQICMFDSNGSTGGCQAVYTVYPNTTTPNPSCTNFTMPTKSLAVDSKSVSGALSQYGWVDSCTDIMVTPKEGTPPFTFTVAPALHPPLNITSNDMSPINWTVALSWASPFFITLADSTGLTWSNGPIHSGNGKTTCLATDSPPETSISVGTIVGSSIAGLIIGSLGSLLAAYIVSKRRNNARRHGREREPTPFYSPHMGGDRESHYSSLPSQASPPLVPIDRVSPFPYPQPSKQRSQQGRSLDPSLTGSIPREYDVEPFQREPARPSIRPSTSGGSEDTTAHPPRQSWLAHDGNDTHMSPTSHRQEGTGTGASSSQVYVIHHDSGRAPVSVITSQGTEVVELPPGYSSDYLGSRSAGASRQQGNSSAPPSDPGRTP